MTKQGQGTVLPALIIDKNKSAIKRLKSQGQNSNTSLDDQKGMTETEPKDADAKYKSQVQMMDKKPFDFTKVKVIVKRGKLGDTELFLDKKWTLDNLEHFRPVIEGVSDDEGIEITLTCNLEAFKFIIKFLEETDHEKRNVIAEEIKHSNVLNIMVTADFLKL